jgi:hypothetical protein
VENVEMITLTFFELAGVWMFGVIIGFAFALFAMIRRKCRE